MIQELNIVKRKINFKTLPERNFISQEKLHDATGNSHNRERSAGRAQNEPFENKLNKMARKGKKYTSTFHREILSRSDHGVCSSEQILSYLRNVNWIHQQSKTNKKPLLFTGNDCGLSLSCWFETPNNNYSTSMSRDGSKARRVHRLFSELSLSLSLTTGTAHRSCQIMFKLLFHDVIALNMHSHTVNIPLPRNISTPVRNFMISVRFCALPEPG